MSRVLNRRQADSPIRLTLASQLGEPVDGAWWLYTASIAQELPELIEALENPLGEVVDISINWSPLEGVPDLDSIHSRGNGALAGRTARPQRVMTVTGDRATARLLVVPCQTSTALAVMLLRRAARLPIFEVHMDTEAFRAADAIVGIARTEHAAEVPSAAGSA